MNCPNCGVYNPEDRTVCWRCAKELPKPVEPPKKKDPRKRLQIYLWIAIVVFFGILVLQFLLRYGAS
jgi:predicted nucleic acid-binding Zn ribbon protein